MAIYGVTAILECDNGCGAEIYDVELTEYVGELFGLSEDMYLPDGWVVKYGEVYCAECAKELGL